jgi:hypothetical protein
MALPDGEKDTPAPEPAGNVPGSVYLVPKPLDENGHARTYGEAKSASAIVSPAGEKATVAPLPDGIVAGLLYGTPKPDPTVYA